MEASEQGTEPGTEQGEGTTPDPASQPGQAPDPTAHEADHSGEAVGESARDDLPADSEERNPAADQAPVATEAQDAIIGDPGFRDEQQPLGSEGSPTNVNQPVRTSAPPPSAQSGTPLPEERENAGDEPDAA